ncbi:hypothetical protein PHYPSEUDO_013617 [Phytophthora pseudosyringae]|uniref:Uncharacterized protein n=1 Tax=Phytophthora pseudosyringae TaxID=221518 RepID=A0A8T1W3P3_9STRA|nr:hypothetical protein PHYPSEUDO_013617 [Phytophthora pseudosyringae]
MATEQMCLTQPRVNPRDLLLASSGFKYVEYVDSSSTKVYGSLKTVVDNVFRGEYEGQPGKLVARLSLCPRLQGSSGQASRLERDAGSHLPARWGQSYPRGSGVARLRPAIRGRTRQQADDERALQLLRAAAEAEGQAVGIYVVLVCELLDYKGGILQYGWVLKVGCRKGLNRSLRVRVGEVCSEYMENSKTCIPRMVLEVPHAVAGLSERVFLKRLSYFGLEMPTYNEKKKLELCDPTPRQVLFVREQMYRVGKDPRFLYPSRNSTWSLQRMPNLLSKWRCSSPRTTGKTATANSGLACRSSVSGVCALHAHVEQWAS